MRQFTTGKRLLFRAFGREEQSQTVRKGGIFTRFKKEKIRLLFTNPGNTKGTIHSAYNAAAGSTQNFSCHDSSFHLSYLGDNASHLASFHEIRQFHRGGTGLFGSPRASRLHEQRGLPGEKRRLGSFLPLGSRRGYPGGRS